MIVLCSQIETGIGLIAPSLPHLRRLVMLHQSEQRRDASQPPNTDDIVTIGRLPRSRSQRFSRNLFKNPTDIGISLTTIQANGERPEGCGGGGGGGWRNRQGDRGGSDDGQLLGGGRDGKGAGGTDRHSYTTEYEHEWDKASSNLEGRTSVKGAGGNV